jgi:hypothetical protein
MLGKKTKVPFIISQLIGIYIELLLMQGYLEKDFTWNRGIRQNLCHASYTSAIASRRRAWNNKHACKVGYSLTA